MPKIETPLANRRAPIPADPWVIASLLQKSIRRGEQETAALAAWTYLDQKESAIWRRLILIAVEDIGVGAPTTVAQVISLGCDPGLRKKLGYASDVARAVARLLADSPKDRSADYLLSIVRKHPCARAALEEAGTLPLDAKLRRVVDGKLPIIERAALVWSTLPLDKDHLSSLPHGLAEAYESLGLGREVTEATKLAARRTRDPITIFGPLVAGALKAAHGRVVASAVPHTVAVGGVPMFALDKHTRLGREAIRRFSEQNAPVKAALGRLVEPNNRSAAYMAAFYADAVPVAKRFAWPGSAELERLGTEADMLGAGAPIEAAEELVSVFRENLDHLNQVRAQVFRSAEVQLRAGR